MSSNRTLLIAGLALLLSWAFLHLGRENLAKALATRVAGAHDFFTGTLECDGAQPASRETQVTIEPHADYMIRATIAGEPEVHLDVMSADAGYDDPAQELTIPRGPKDREFALTFDSGAAPSNVAFRIFYLAKQPIEVKSVDLLRVPNGVTRLLRILTELVGALGALALYAFFRPPFAVHVFAFGALVSFLVATNPLEGDNRNYAMVARSLLVDGDAALNEFSDRIGADGDYGIRRDEGKIYNYFPLGPSLVLAPMYVVAGVEGGGGIARELLAGRLATAACFGAALALFFLLAATFVRRGDALVLTLVFGFCSHQFSQDARSFWSHAAAMPFIVGALLALRSKRETANMIGGLLLVLGYLMRPTVALMVPVAGIWLLIHRRRDLAGFVAGCLLGALFVVSARLALFGRVTTLYDAVDRLGFVTAPEALAGDLVSPNRGLFVFMPWALFSVWGMGLALRKGADPFFRLVTGMIVAHVLLVATFPHWWAGYSYGPRLLVETTPLLVLLLVPLMQSPAWRFTDLKVIAAALISFSLFVQISGVTHAAAEWNTSPADVDRNPARIWDWRDMQMFRWLRAPAGQQPAR